MDAGRPEVESKEQAMRLAPDGLDETWILQGFPDDLSCLDSGKHKQVVVWRKRCVFFQFGGLNLCLKVVFGRLLFACAWCGIEYDYLYITHV